MPPCFMRCVVDANILLKVSDENDISEEEKNIVDSFVVFSVLVFPRGGRGGVLDEHNLISYPLDL